MTLTWTSYHSRVRRSNLRYLEINLISNWIYLSSWGRIKMMNQTSWSHNWCRINFNKTIRSSSKFKIRTANILFLRNLPTTQRSRKQLDYRQQWIYKWCVKSRTRLTTVKLHKKKMWLFLQSLWKIRIQLRSTLVSTISLLNHRWTYRI